MLLHRRLTDPRIRATSSYGDIAILAILVIQLAIGLGTIAVSMQHLDGEEMVRFMTWAQGIFTFQPGVAALVADAHWLFKLHLFLGLTIFLVSLGILFLASLVAYGLIRTVGHAPPTGSVEMPAALWASTIVILVSSVTIQHALACIQHEKQTHFRLSMTATLGLAWVFMLIQAPSLATLLSQHAEMRDAAIASGEKGVLVYGLAFGLILLHAAHVLGGVLPLTWATIRAWRGGYDHERHETITYLTMYWHFLDVVWLIMFAVLLAGA